MFDPEFDPYDEIMRCQHNIMELVKALNQQSEMLRELNEQHRQLINHIRHHQGRLKQLETEIFILKNP